MDSSGSGCTILGGRRETALVDISLIINYPWDNSLDGDRGTERQAFVGWYPHNSSHNGDIRSCLSGVHRLILFMVNSSGV